MDSLAYFRQLGRAVLDRYRDTVSTGTAPTAEPTPTPAAVEDTAAQTPAEAVSAEAELPPAPDPAAEAPAPSNADEPPVPVVKSLYDIQGSLLRKPALEYLISVTTAMEGIQNGELYRKYPKWAGCDHRSLTACPPRLNPRREHHHAPTHRPALSQAGTASAHRCAIPCIDADLIDYRVEVSEG